MNKKFVLKIGQITMFGQIKNLILYGLGSIGTLPLAASQWRCSWYVRWYCTGTYCISRFISCMNRELIFCLCKNTFWKNNDFLNVYVIGARAPLSNVKKLLYFLRGWFISNVYCFDDFVNWQIDYCSVLQKFLNPWRRRSYFRINYEFR